MASLRNKRRLETMSRKTQVENSRNGQSRNMSVRRISEEYITQVLEEIEGRVTNELSQEFSKTESLVLGTLSKLDELPLNQQIRTLSGTVPRKSRIADVGNPESTVDRSQNDPHPEVEFSIYQSRNSNDLNPREASRRCLFACVRIGINY